MCLRVTLESQGWGYLSKPPYPIFHLGFGGWKLDPCTGVSGTVLAELFSQSVGIHFFHYGFLMVQIKVTGSANYWERRLLGLINTNIETFLSPTFELLKPSQD